MTADRSSSRAPRVGRPALALALLLLAGTGHAGADGSPPALWRTVDDAPPAPPVAGVAAATAVRVDHEAIAALRAGDQARLDLPAGSVAMTIERRNDLAPRRFVLTGRTDGDATGAFSLAVHDGGVAGLLRTDATQHRLRGGADGFVRLERLDESVLPWCDLDGAPAPAIPAEAGAATGSCDDGSVIDLLVVYTRDARDAAGGTGNILAEIDLMVENMNTALANSRVDPRMHIVYSWETATPQSLINLGNFTGRSDGVIDGVHTLRDAYGADEVALVTSGGGGVANGLRTLDPGEEATAFCVNGRNSMPFIIAHEVGHNLGCCHARGDGGGCPAQGGLLFPFSNGHRFVGDSANLWRTVMAYSPGTWSALYSNPEVLFDGVATGIPEGDPDSADNTKTINLAAFTVSNWRCNDGICEGLDLPSDAEDCNENDVPDLCEIAVGLVGDADGDGIPDECECVGDADGNEIVDVGDVLIVLTGWGECEGACPGDFNYDGRITLIDLLRVLANWGPCA